MKLKTRLLLSVPALLLPLLTNTAAWAMSISVPWSFTAGGGGPTVDGTYSGTFEGSLISGNRYRLTDFIVNTADGTSIPTGSWGDGTWDGTASNFPLSSYVFDWDGSTFSTLYELIPVNPVNPVQNSDWFFFEEDGSTSLFAGEPWPDGVSFNFSASGNIQVFSIEGVQWNDDLGRQYVAGANNVVALADTDSAATAVPTPALLPGLLGMGIATLRKRKLAQSEAG